MIFTTVFGDDYVIFAIVTIMSIVIYTMNTVILMIIMNIVIITIANPDIFVYIESIHFFCTLSPLPSARCP